MPPEAFRACLTASTTNKWCGSAGESPPRQFNGVTLCMLCLSAQKNHGGQGQKHRPAKNQPPCHHHSERPHIHKDRLH